MGGIAGLTVTAFNIFWFIYQNSQSSENFNRHLVPYTLIETLLWLNHYLFIQHSFEYLNTAFLMPIAGDQYQIEEEPDFD